MEEFILKTSHTLMIPPALDEKKVSGVKNFSASSVERPITHMLSEIREVYSHPQVFCQCKDFLEEFLPDAEYREYGDSASSAREVSRLSNRSIAAISPEFCANFYNLQILKKEIENEPGNATRFLLFSTAPSKIDEAMLPAITTILFETKHEPWSLVSALSAFARNDINLTKLETYMASRERRKPTFYVDVCDHFSSERMQRAIIEFDKHVEKWQMLGTYPASLERGVVSGFLPV